MRVRLSVFLSVCACVYVSVCLSVSVVLVCVSTTEGGRGK